MKPISVILVLLITLASPAFSDEATTKPILLKVIPLLQQGNPDYSNMEAMLRAAVKQQQSAVESKLKQLGDVVSVEYEGEQNGSDVYAVEFENGFNVWMIGLGASGKISVLYFQ